MISVSTRDEATPEDVQPVLDGLERFNAAAAPLHEVRRLVVLAHDADERIVGGALGRTWGANAELQVMWIEESQRGQGVGGRLMHAFLEAATERGCRRAFTESFSFQAIEFYESHGFERRLEFDDFAPGVSKAYLVRELA